MKTNNCELGKMVAKLCEVKQNKTKNVDISENEDI